MSNAVRSSDLSDVLHVEPLLISESNTSLGGVRHKNVKTTPEKASIEFLFRERTRLDSFLLLVGSTVAVISGLSLPFLAVIMGGMTDSFVNATILVEYPLSIVNTSSGLRFFSDIYSLEHFRKSAHIRVLQSFLIGAFLLFAASIQVVLCGIFSKYYIFDDFERIKEGIGDKVALAIQYTNQFVGGFLVAFVYDWKLTLVMMSLTPFIAVCGAFVARLMSSSALREDKNYSKAMNLAIEVLNSMPTVAAFNGQSAELKRYKLALEATTFDCVMRSVYIGAAFAATFFIMYFSVMMGSLALGRAGPQFTAIRTAQITASKFQGCFNFENSLKKSSLLDNSQQENLSNVPSKISVENVSFSYPTRPDLPVLTDFSMDVNPGQSVALVGKSGAGKSTVFALLLKLYSPSSGKIKIDDQMWKT
uniref:ABC transmembrane type-1 domain-containing protein n=1 Tax=Ditylenchus dipsaci TaxID=166011 RepID=A0A915CUZ6_9BILA